MNTDTLSLFTRFLIWIGLYQVLSCFYCNNVHIFNGSSKKNPRNWYCDVCESQNVTNEKGEIVDDVPQMHFSSMNKTSGSARVRNPPPEKEQTFCSECVNNQNLVISLLGSYIPADDDPDFEYAMATFDTYRKRIEANYPVVCSECEEKVTSELNQKNYQMKARVFGEALKTSNSHEIKEVLTLRFPNVLRWLLYTIFYFSVNILTLVFLGFVVAYPNLVDITPTAMDPVMNSIVADKIVLGKLPFHQVIKICLYYTRTTFDYLWENVVEKGEFNDNCAHLLIAWLFIFSILSCLTSFYDPTMFKRMVNYKRQPMNVELFKDYHMLLGITRICLSIFYRFFATVPEVIQRWTAIVLAFNVMVMLYTWIKVNTKDPVRVHLGSGIMGTPVGKRISCELPSEANTVSPKSTSTSPAPIEHKGTPSSQNSGPEIGGITSSLSLGTSSSYKRPPRNPFIIHRNRVESMKRRDPQNNDSGSDGENDEINMELESDYDNMDWEPSSFGHRYGGRNRARVANQPSKANNDYDVNAPPIIRPPKFHLREPDTGLEDLLASSLRITESHPLVQSLKEFDRRVTRQGNVVKGILLAVSVMFLLSYTHTVWQFLYVSMCVFTCTTMRSYYGYLKGSAVRAANSSRIDMNARKRTRAIRFSKLILLLVHLRVYLFLLQVAIIVVQVLSSETNLSLEIVLKNIFEQISSSDLLTTYTPDFLNSIDYFQTNQFSYFWNYLATHPLDTLLALTTLAFPTINS
ncbi:hypothetical protein K7432_005755 [Basidiobolus ranarum]|uniref:Ima1 N-terminal domain-containing protein n=1 Tax=Basidiobolus ranarum TaxID=34480 RepID=A0ABR2W2T4_9FUNG